MTKEQAQGDKQGPLATASESGEVQAGEQGENRMAARDPEKMAGSSSSSAARAKSSSSTAAAGSEAALTPFEERQRKMKEALTSAQGEEVSGPAALRWMKSALTWFREKLAALQQSYQAQSQFFKYRVWIVALWFIFTAGSAAWAFWPANTMGALVRTAPDPADGTEIVSLENDSQEHWREVVIILDGLYEHRIPELAPGHSVQIHARRFKGRKGVKGADENPPRHYRPHNITVKTKGQGSYTGQVER